MKCFRATNALAYLATNAPAYYVPPSATKVLYRWREDNDDSGLRPSKQPPIAIGGTVAYQCPGVKSVSGASSADAATFRQVSLRQMMPRQCSPVWLQQTHKSSGMHYKPTTIINDDSRVVNELETSLTDDARVIIYDCHIIMVQATYI
jgi:hypothetical protein